MCPSEANDSSKLPAVQANSNPINIFSINSNIILNCAFSLNMYEYPKHYEHQYCHNQLKNHGHSYNPVFFHIIS